MAIKKLNLMKNKTGWVRILEAAVAVMLILGFMLYFRAKVEQTPLADQMYELTHKILSEASSNISIRNEILEGNVQSLAIKNFFESRINTDSFDYSFNICNLGDSCLANDPLPEKKEIFADSIAVSASPFVEGYSPKKLALFVWIK